MEAMIAAGGARLRHRRRRQPRDERARGPRGARGACSARRSRCPTASRSCGRCTRSGTARATRVYGPDLMAALLRARGRSAGSPMYLYGGRTPEALELLEARLRERFPGLRDRRRLLAAVPRAHARRRRSARSPTIDALGRRRRVGRHRPAQAGAVDARDAPAPGARRCWSASAPPSTSTPGSSRRRRAWMQRSGLEWAYRLSREPRRLWRRYARYNPRFVAGFARQYLATAAHGAERLRRERATAVHAGAANLMASMSASQSTADVAVVGLGRVGLPLALSFADRGLRVIGIDNDPARLGAVRRRPHAVRRDRRAGAARPRARRRTGCRSPTRVADAARRAPHRDHARHAVVLAHRDRHARHPLGARRPARRARDRATR